MTMILQNHYKQFISVIILVLLSIDIIQAQDVKGNQNIDFKLGTVVFTPIDRGVVQEGQFPIVALGQTLNLRFDIINGSGEDVLARIIHCNKNWNVSDIDAIDFLSEFNEFRIDNHTPSFSTITEYIHYNFTLPVVQISGNYTVEVYREDDENAIIFSRRFMVFQQIVFFSSQLKKGISGINTAEKQQFELQVNYSQAGINDPEEELFICIYKNNDWNSQRWLDKYQFNNSQEGKIIFDPYDKNALFDAGNEYRVFDIRSTQYSRENVRHIQRQVDKITAVLELVELKNRSAYSEEKDINGAFIVSTDDQSKDPDLEGDYIDVTFQVKALESITVPIYIIGDFTVGMSLNQTKLQYNQAKNLYTGRYKLKQGFYNYAVITYKGGKIVYLDGNYFATQNVYHFLSYRRLAQNRYDELVGYNRFDTKN